MTNQTLWKRVSNALKAKGSDGLDITEFAHEFTGTLTRAERDQLAERGVAEIARGIRASQRNPRRSIDARASRKSTRRLRLAGGNERAKVGGELDLAYFSVWTGERHVWLLDCRVEDLIGAIGEHDRLAAKHSLSARQLSDVKRLLESQRKAKVVGDLPRPRLLQVFESNPPGEDDARGRLAA